MPEEKKEEPFVMNVTFRYVPAFKSVEMFWYNERGVLSCFCLREGHNEACLDYYRKDTIPVAKKEGLEKDVKDIVEYYEQDDDIKLHVVKRLARPTRSR